MSPRVLAGARLAAHEQIRGRLSRRSATTRLRARGRRRAARDRARGRAVRRGLRERAAVLGLASESRGVSRAARAGRHVARHAARRTAAIARTAPPTINRARSTTSCRTTSTRRRGEIDYEQVATLAREHRPKLVVAGFSAYSRVVDWAALSRDRGRGRRAAARRHRARRGARRGRPLSEPRGARGRRRRRRRTRRCADRAAA